MKLWKEFFHDIDFIVRSILYTLLAGAIVVVVVGFILTVIIIICWVYKLWPSINISKKKVIFTCE